MQGNWTESELSLLREHYPTKGLAATTEIIGRSRNAVRGKASELGLSLDRASEFWKDFQRRAAQTKVGRKRPDQSIVMKAMHAAGKFPPMSAERIANMSARQKEWIKENGHPRGALGMKHTQETKEKVSAAWKAWWRSMTPEKRQDMIHRSMRTRAKNGNMAPRGRSRGRWKAAWHTIGGKERYFRSRWEANYARFLEWRKSRGEIIDWTHEPETFWFDGIKRGCVSYLPDFRVDLPGGLAEYHEVKGWMDDRSKTKIRRMKKYHPSVVLVVVDARAYKQLEKLMSTVVPGWET